MFPGIPGIREHCDHRAARERLEAEGWRWHARGDWAQVHLSPDGRRVARVVPFDPAYALHVQVCVAHPDVAHFPRIDWCTPLAPAGELVVMERLEPADPERASRLCCLLGRTAHLERAVSDAECALWRSERNADPALRRLHEILEAAAARGARTLAHFGGLDVRPGNVMQDASGQLKLIDPYFVAGKELIAAMLADVDAVARHYTRDELRGFLEIAAFDEERAAPGAVLAQLRARVAGLAHGSGAACVRPNAGEEAKPQ